MKIKKSREKQQTVQDGLEPDSGFVSSYNSLSKYSDELLVVLKKTNFQLKKKQQATYSSILIMNFKMKKSRCPAPMDHRYTHTYTYITSQNVTLVL